MLAWAILLFLLVETALIYAVFRFRRTRTGSKKGKSSSNRGIEFAWTLAPALIVLGIGVPAVFLLFEGTTYRPDPTLEVQVTGHPGGWNVHYPATGVSSRRQLHLPVGRPAHVTLTAEESAHSYRVPELGGKWDLIPGRTNHIWITPARTAVIPLPCPEACAGSHEPLAIVVESEQDFRRWLSSRKPDHAPTPVLEEDPQREKGPAAAKLSPSLSKPSKRLAPKEFPGYHEAASPARVRSLLDPSYELTLL